MYRTAREQAKHAKKLGADFCLVFEKMVDSFEEDGGTAAADIEEKGLLHPSRLPDIDAIHVILPPENVDPETEMRNQVYATKKLHIVSSDAAHVGVVCLFVCLLLLTKLYISTDTVLCILLLPTDGAPDYECAGAARPY